jgi:hypothetical protein
MAAKLGTTFLVGAVGPVNYAGNCILASKVPEGLRELTPENLVGGIERGVTQAATRVGVSISDVERLLPMAELRTIAARIGLSQKNATLAWEAHAGELGGLLKGVAELTADGRAPDTGLCLERLATKVSRDADLAVPLAALAADVRRWQDLIARCRDILDDGAILAKAYERRQIRRVLLATVPAVVAILALSLALWIRAAQARVDEALAVTDACAAIDIPPDDLARSSSSQKKKVEERKATCAAQREREARERKSAEEREARAREALQKKETREALCAALASHVQAGKVMPDDEATAGESLGLMRRIARGALSPSDYGPDDAPLPCGDTKAGPGIAAAFDRAIIAAPAAWANAPDPSSQVRSALERHADELPSAPKQVVAQRAYAVAKKALLYGDAGVQAQAVRLCMLKDALGLHGGGYCVTITAGKAKAP